MVRNFRKESEIWTDNLQEAVNETKKQQENLYGVENGMPAAKSMGATLTILVTFMMMT